MVLMDRCFIGIESPGIKTGNKYFSVCAATVGFAEAHVKCILRLRELKEAWEGICVFKGYIKKSYFTRLGSSQRD